MYSFIQQTFIKCLLGAMFCTRHHGYNGKQKIYLLGSSMINPGL